jgi:hypothetical protein
VQKRGEPLWLPEDTELALEWQAERRGECKGCGQPLVESTEPGNARHYRAEELTCYGCKVIGYRQEAMSEEDRKSHGVQIYLTRGQDIG